jgi:hypothetical protein
MLKRLIAVLFIALFLGGTIACAPSPYKPYEPPKVSFDKTEAYVIDLSKIKKPDKPKYAKLNAQMQPAAEGEPVKYLAFTADEFKKIMALSELFNAQQELLKDHETLVNTHIDTINALKELVSIKEQMIDQYVALYAASENAYRYEKWDHNWDNANNKIVQILMFAGIVLLML